MGEQGDEITSSGLVTKNQRGYEMLAMGIEVVEFPTPSVAETLFSVAICSAGADRPMDQSSQTQMLGWPIACFAGGVLGS